MVKRLAIEGYVRPTLRRGRIDGRCQCNSKRRMGAGNPVEDLPGGSILELDVEYHRFDFAVTQPGHGVVDPGRSEYRVVACPERLFEGVADHWVIFSNKDPHKTVVSRTRPTGK